MTRSGSVWWKQEKQPPPGLHLGVTFPFILVPIGPTRRDVNVRMRWGWCFPVRTEGNDQFWHLFCCAVSSSQMVFCLNIWDFLGYTLVCANWIINIIFIIWTYSGMYKSPCQRVIVSMRTRKGNFCVPEDAWRFSWCFLHHYILWMCFNKWL